MLFRRFLSLILALVLFAGVLPVGALASDASPEPQCSVHVNPLYTDAAPIDVDPASEEMPEIDESAVTFRTSVQAVGADLRNGMKQRKEVIAVGLASKSQNDYSSDMVYAIFDEAIVHTGVPTEGDYLRWQYGGYTCWRYYRYYNSTYHIFYVYVMTYYTTAQQEAAVTAGVNNVLSRLNQNGLSNYEKICYVYDYICGNVTYDYTNLENDSYKLKYTAYAALINKTAVFQGYALLFYRFALEMGIDCRLIAGIGNGGRHGWNIVKLGDYYYNLDSTWDSERTTYRYFLVTDANFGDHTRFDEYATTAFYRAYPMATNDFRFTSVDFQRISGPTRYETGTRIADKLKQTLGVTAFENIIIASGTNFADALAGSYLSAVKHAPILLSRSGSAAAEAQNSELITYIRSNLAGSGTVYILGGTAAVPQSLENLLTEAGIRVMRLRGATRYETNLRILEEAGVSGNTEILVCTGTNFADSLSASALGKPILLVNNKIGELTDGQLDYLENLSGTTYTIIGGTGAVSADLAEDLASYGRVVRLSGKTRYETSVLVAKTYFNAPSSMVLAYAANYPDGLCGGALAYAIRVPLILTANKYETAAETYAAENRIRTGMVLGGASLISDDTAFTILGYYR